MYKAKSKKYEWHLTCYNDSIHGNIFFLVMRDCGFKVGDLRCEMQVIEETLNGHA